MSFWMMTVPFPPGRDGGSKADRVYLHIVRDKDGKATEVEAVTAREILEKIAEQDLKKTDKE